MKELKYQMVFREDTGSTISIKDVDKNYRYRYNYYVEGYDKETGEKVHVPLYPVFCKNKRDHFRSFARNRDKFSINVESVNESIIHHRVKELFMDGTIEYIILPKISINTPFGVKQISPAKYINIQSVKEEQVYKFDSAVNEYFVKFDIEFETSDSMCSTLELEVVYKHDIDNSKSNLIRALKKNTIKIMIDPKEYSIDDPDLDDKLIKLLSENNYIWVYNNEAERLEQFVFNIKPISNIRTPDYSWAGDFVGDVPQDCTGYYHNPTTERSYITAKHCKNCPYYVCHHLDKFLYCRKCNYGLRE